MYKIKDDDDLRRLCEIAETAPYPTDFINDDPETYGPTMGMVQKYVDRTGSEYGKEIRSHWNLADAKRIFEESEKKRKGEL